MNQNEESSVPPLALTIPEAAREARVSARTIATWIASGKLRSTKIVGVRRILRDDLRRLLAGEGNVENKSDDNEGLPRGNLIKRSLLESIAGPEKVAALIELGKLRYAVGRILKQDVEAVFSAAVRSSL